VTTFEGLVESSPFLFSLKLVRNQEKYVICGFLFYMPQISTGQPKLKHKGKRASLPKIKIHGGKICYNNI
jgi:hypothetical protein